MVGMRKVILIIRFMTNNYTHILVTIKKIVAISLFFTHNLFALQIGDIAPDFDASTSLGKLNFYNWSGNNWVILFSHPSDFTPVCTTELAEVAKLQPHFEKRDVKVLALSSGSVADHLEWIPHINEFKNSLKNNTSLIGIVENLSENTDVRYPIIADEDLSIAMHYGMYHPKAKPNSNSLGSGVKETVRSVFIIDSNKIVQTILVYPKNVGRNFTEIVRIVDALQLSEKHKVSTPANWKMGDPVIVSNDIPTEDIKDKYDTKEVDIFQNYLKLIDQPGFFEGSEKSKERSRGGFK